MRKSILIVALLATLVFIGSVGFTLPMLGNTPNSNGISTVSFSGSLTADNTQIFALAEDTGINGTVTDASTLAPIAGATVKAGALISVTDSQGHYVITIAPGNYTVMASKLDYTSQSKPATVIVNQTTPVNFNLSKVAQGIGWIAGVVTDANTSMPLTGATVAANGFSATTNSSGQYKLQVGAMKTYNVTAEKTGYEEKTISNVTVPTNQTIPLNFAITPSVTPPPSTKGWITGTVTDANTTAPLQGATVTANGFSAVTNSSGHYKIEVTAPKTYNVTAQKTGYMKKTVSNVTVAANQTRTGVDFALTRSPTPPPPQAGQVKIKIEPRALNLKSHGRWITVEIKFPQNITVSDVNASSIRLNGTIAAAANAPMHAKDNKLIVKFDRQAVQELILSKGQSTKFGRVTLTITGDTNSGTTFSGSNTIKTILPMPKSHNEKHENHENHGNAGNNANHRNNGNHGKP